VNKQSTLLNSLFKLTANSSAQTNEDLHHFQKEMEAIRATLNNITFAENKSKLSATMDEAFTIGFYSLGQYQAKQEQLYHTLINPSSALTPRILKPDIFTKQLERINENLKEDLALPFKIIPSNIFRQYRICTVDLVVHQEHIVFLIKLPLVLKRIYDVYQVTAVPRPLNDTYYHILSLSTPIFAIDKAREKYFHLSHNTLRACAHDEYLFICEETPSEFHAKEDFCLLHLFFGQSDVQNCTEKIFRPPTEIWTQLATKNSLMVNI
jgi:hypothetical protein